MKYSSSDVVKVDDHGGIKQAPHKEYDKKLKKRPSPTASIEKAMMTFPRSSSVALKAQVASKTAKKQVKEKLEHKTKQLDPTPASRHPESVKSRSKKLVLDSGASKKPSTCSSPQIPRWGINLKRPETIEPTIVTHDHTVTDALHEEIVAYTTYTKTTVAKMAVHIEAMIENVRTCVQSLWPQSHVETFGSYATGIWLPSSDVDLVILNVVEMQECSTFLATQLNKLAKVLETKDWVDSLVVLESARVPVLKLVSTQSAVPMDITFESTATHSGLLARDLVQRYADTMPELYPLAIVLKQMLRERELNDAYTGGLSSYSIVLMVIHFLQLWRHGDVCFQAAAIYASGSVPPSPSILAATTEALKFERLEQDVRPQKIDETSLKTHNQGTPEPKEATSYAAIVMRSKQDARATSRSSYAAIVKENPPVRDRPSSYAAAVTTVHAPHAVACVHKRVETKGNNLFDAMSSSSSTADTEDSCSSCSQVSCTDSDESDGTKRRAAVSLGAYTMRFLEFFGLVFDYDRNGVSVRDGGYIYRLADRNCTHVVGTPVVVIEDPIYPDRNVSASSFAFGHVVAVWEDAYYALKYFRPSRFTPCALSCLLDTSDARRWHRTKVETAR
ncbi:hypothetical protein PsorP6_009369 [Peronosclerospora sorghi]|uniref:Uncharacterized protein n=1 Tax=Peronosclerospora sorghi TaxID=230839 RepID=A0ACC0VZB7_9STRA|nr:hypothetical protein PsorP6_009369 [Peronosclerospora sorghi]